MKVAIGSDHAGFSMKTEIVNVLRELDVEVVDCGTDSGASVDYPDFAGAVAGLVSTGKVDRGILLCGTGVGMSIAANKFSNVRAALSNDLYTARLSRLHNDANVLAMGARVISGELAAEITRVWLATPFEGNRHQRRLEKIRKIEKDVQAPRD